MEKRLEEKRLLRRATVIEAVEALLSAEKNELVEMKVIACQRVEQRESKSRGGCETQSWEERSMQDPRPTRCTLTGVQHKKQTKWDPQARNSIGRIAERGGGDMGACGVSLLRPNRQIRELARPGSTLCCPAPRAVVLIAVGRTAWTSSIVVVWSWAFWNQEESWRKMEGSGERRGYSQP